MGRKQKEDEARKERNYAIAKRIFWHLLIPAIVAFILNIGRAARAVFMPVPWNRAEFQVYFLVFFVPLLIISGIILLVRWNKIGVKFEKQKKKAEMSTAALVLGICSLVFLLIPSIAWLIAIVAFVISLISVIRISKNKKSTGKGKAIAGLVMSSISIIIIGIFIIFAYTADIDSACIDICAEYNATSYEVFNDPSAGELQDFGCICYDENDNVIGEYIT
ncbi:MAG: hypothetical protein GF329_14905 [Candidatus Lokiarchaeota archaeon]|nr:hypothetical protein [Candidatus Lokiarchaeota archaeon]